MIERSGMATRLRLATRISFLRRFIFRPFHWLIARNVSNCVEATSDLGFCLFSTENLRFTSFYHFLLNLKFS
ncbi:unnamed protein product [Caenorhabditis auriculariae]|uniref:Uncharacterized protein n=1 Tax=Caenorhabditis auriculariae TaxID=2777116 RepID=A0A8S1GYZ3_9PELO|nr:unnamed protein product [Caenorhabditis auriculariae]